MPAIREHDLATAFDASLRRSRRRRDLARRLRARRRRSRGGTGTFAGVLAIAALAAPLALANDSATTVQRGSRGDGVAAIQRALGMSATGYFGPITRAAVRRFQAAHGLEADGVVGPLTRAALGLGAAHAAAAPTTSAAAPQAGGDPRLQRIAACESGGDPTAVSASGRYRGKYQFSRETWRAMGGTGDPAQAPEAEQDRRAAALLARDGTGPWPNCA